MRRAPARVMKVMGDVSVEVRCARPSLSYANLHA
jgi:hypothetical protein